MRKRIAKQEALFYEDMLKKEINRDRTDTGVNRLTGTRDQLSRAMTKEEAQERLERELASRRYQRYQPHTRLRVEHLEPAQLTFNFQEND